MAIGNLRKCNDERGPVCFAYDQKGRCKCLCDTRQVPCPFWKDIEKVKEENPQYKL